MTMTLNSWQERLEQHFTLLHEQRSGLGAPLFALEHGLEDAEVQDVSEGIRTHIRSAAPADRHWLVWAIYATELGYQYDGEEYWQSFEKKTPGWSMRGDRDWIRSCFRKLAKAYQGFEPSGPWARHFSIICWPIMHAILPEDLQRQLAEILYDIRHSFRAELLDSPQLLGEAVAARSWRATPRFQNLAQEPLLVGQIAAALLLRGDDHSPLILPSTLKRIAKSLDKERRSREWLRDARTAARVRVTGVARRLDGLGSDVHQGASRPIEALGIEPRLFLQPRSDGWDVILELPDFAPLLTRFPRLTAVLTQSQCVVAGSSGRPLAKGRLVHYGSQRIVLRRWPEPSEILLKFDRRMPELDYLLSAECMLRPGPHWLFKVDSTGLAHEIRMNVVRPSKKYVLLTRDSVGHNQFLSPVDVHCDGITAWSLDPPDTFTQPSIQSMQRIGLQTALHVDVVPAAVMPLGWDGEGRAQWLTTDTPCIAVSSDHAIQAIGLNLEGSAPEKIETIPETGQTTFFELAPLPPGNHRLHVILKPSLPANQILTGFLEVTVREPKLWNRALTEQNPLVVLVDPPNPTLEQLWSGAVAVEIFGPDGRQVVCEISLFKRSVDGTAAFRRRFAPVAVPLTREHWQEYFARAQTDKQLQSVYDESARCEVRFIGEELGQFSFACDRESSALRWSLKSDNSRYVLRLQDDTGGSPPSLSFFSYDRPDAPVSLNAAADAQVEITPDPRGGLYVAKNASLVSAMAVAPTVLHSFQDLRVTPHLGRYERTGTGIKQLLKTIELWGGANLTGNVLSGHRRRLVLRTLIDRLTSLTCGEEWVRLEHAINKNPERILDLKSAVSRKPMERGLGAALWVKRQDMARRPAGDRVLGFSQLVHSYLELPGFVGIPSNGADRYGWVAEFALRLATSPHTLRGWAGNHLRSGIDYLLRCSALARAARFTGLTVLLCAEERTELLTSSVTWEWQ